MKQRLWRVVSVAVMACMPFVVGAQQQEDPVAEYRELFGEDNPAELWEQRGEGLWREARGPKNVPLSSCDFGLGAGVIAGAYAQMPRYFADTGRVEDLESRLVTCMSTIQGFDRETMLRSRFGDGDKKSDLEALTAYIVGQSRGHTVEIKLQHPAEKAAYETGKSLFFYRAGPHDFSCASCHGQEGTRIRLQDLPKLTKNPGDGIGFAAWPAYRVSNGQMWGMQQRLNDCYRQQRFPYPGFGSDVTIALGTYLGVNSAGAVSVAPAIKR